MASSPLPPAPGKQEFCWQCRDEHQSRLWPSPSPRLSPRPASVPRGQVAQPHCAARTNGVRVCCPHCENLGRRTVFCSVRCSPHPTPQSPSCFKGDRICPQGVSPESEPYESAGPAQPSSINTTEGFLLGWTEQDQGLQAEILMDFRKNIKFFLSRIPWEKQRNG